MSMRRLSVLLVLILGLAPLTPRAALGPGGESVGPHIGAGAAPAPEAGSMTGQLLVASPDMADPRFAHTVILVVRHDRNGAFGIVLNRPVETRPYTDLLKALGDKNPNAEGSVRIFAGGPVQRDLGFVVHSAEYRRPETVGITGTIALTSTPEVLRDMAHGHGPAKALVAFGYAGWGAGQLENEMDHHGWLTAPADPAIVFDDDRAKLWDIAMAHRTINL